MKDDERSTIACRKGRNWLQHTILSARGFPATRLDTVQEGERQLGNSRCIPSQEVVASLCGCKFTYRWKHAKGVTRQHNYVRRLAIDHARNFCIRNVLYRVGAASILSDADIIVIGNTRCRIIDDIFKDAAITDGVVDVWFLFG